MEYKTTILNHTRFNITEQTSNLSFNDIYYMTSSVSERDENLAGAHMRQLLRLSNKFEDHFFNSPLMIVHVALPYIFTEKILRKKSFLHPNGFRRNFIAGKNRAIPSWQYRSILPARVNVQFT